MEEDWLESAVGSLPLEAVDLEEKMVVDSAEAVVVTRRRDRIHPVEAVVVRTVAVEATDLEVVDSAVGAVVVEDSAGLEAAVEEDSGAAGLAVEDLAVVDSAVVDSAAAGLAEEGSRRRRRKPMWAE